MPHRTPTRARFLRTIVVVLAAVGLAGCGSKVQAPGPTPEPRGFEMALTPSPPGQQDIVRFFASMGLRTRTLAAKPVLSTWEAAYARPYSP